MFDFIYTVSNPYLVILFVLIITGTGLPIPEEVPVVAAAVLSYHGHMDVRLALVCCLVGALLGDCIMYAVGYHFGRSVVQEHRWFARFLTPQREARIERMIQEHGIKMFLMARFLVGLRSPVYLTSGILRVPFRRFILIDSICATIVIGVFFAISYAFAPHIEMAWRWIRGAEYTLTGLALVAIGVGVYWYLHKRRGRWRRVRSRREERRNRTTTSRATSIVTDPLVEGRPTVAGHESNGWEKPGPKTPVELTSASGVPDAASSVDGAVVK